MSERNPRNFKLFLHNRIVVGDVTGNRVVLGDAAARRQPCLFSCHCKPLKF